MNTGTTTVNLTRAGHANVTATGVMVVDNTRINLHAPDHGGARPGEWDVVVTNPDGQEGVLPAGFMITAPAPSVISITPAAGVNTSAAGITDTDRYGFPDRCRRQPDPGRARKCHRNRYHDR